MTSAADICYSSNNCHPETESKDPYQLATACADARNFRIVIRFFDDHETERPATRGGVAAVWESPAPFDFAQGRIQCRVALRTKNESRKDVTLAAQTTNDLESQNR